MLAVERRGRRGALALAFVLSGCAQLEPQLEGYGCESDADCVEGYFCDPPTGICITCVDLDGDGYGLGVGCQGSDCDDELAACTTDCSSADGDAIADCNDACLDVDGDGVGDGNLDNTACVTRVDDEAPNDPTACTDTDGDGCDDCSSTAFDPNDDGTDTDDDGECNISDDDDDADGVADSSDSDPVNSSVCRDVDGDGCDDCVLVNPPDPAQDGPDFDGDGQCDAGDNDDDDDGVDDGDDIAPTDPARCTDADGDSCDDCAVTGGPPNANDDGADNDLDGACDAGDDDDDNDQVPDAQDSAPFDRSVCQDADADGCNDCAVTNGPPNVANDGVDTDGDGQCDSGDNDDDDDTVPDTSDVAPFNALRCYDLDFDGCDDCAVTAGPPSEANDGADGDGDGICDLTDDCTDADGDGLGNGNLGNATCAHVTTDSNDSDGSACADVDDDTCDDCSSGSWNTANDGPGGADNDRDGQCDGGDDDDDDDGVPDGDDDDPFDAFVCRDADNDTCDDCSVGGSSAPNADGPDTDGDGQCDSGDTCTDVDGDGTGIAALDRSGCLSPVSDSNDNLATVCADTDADSCDDCSTGTWDPSGDGTDGDSDGICDATDDCTDADGDGAGNGLDNSGCVVPNLDSDDANAFACADTDGDTCDDCVAGAYNPTGDGADNDGDGLCDDGDTDDDDDNVPDGDDDDPFDENVCRDIDGDTCDDCSQGGVSAPANDGTDTDSDGLCDIGDPCTDADGDGIGRGGLARSGCSHTISDSDDSDGSACADTDGDTCDDCTFGTWAPASDGPDFDNDGECDDGDTDDDDDGVDDLTDLAANNPAVCRDADGDGCDDCSQVRAPPDPSNDGADGDADGACDISDACTDADGDNIGNGNLGNSACINPATDSNDTDPTRCLDTDADGCDDCSGGAGWAPFTDGTDTDSDGACDLTDACTDDDGDGLGNGNLSNSACADPTDDSDDTDPTLCADTDADTCEDCSSGLWAPSADGRDTDGDGICDLLSWYDTDWGFRKELTTMPAQITGDLANFPMLVAEIDAELSKARLDGADLVLCAADGKTVLDYEIERWQQSSGTLSAWVRLDPLSSTVPTVLYLYYGNNAAGDQQNPAGVWDPAYVGVWHLAEDPGPGGAGEILDSTSFNNHGTAHDFMAPTDLTPSPRGLAIDFNIAEASLDMGSAASLDDRVTYTVESWVFARTISAACPNIFSKASASGAHSALSVCADGSAVGRRDRDPAAEILWDSAAGTVTTVGWHHIVAVVDLSDLVTPVAAMWIDGMDRTDTLVPGSGPLQSDAAYDVTLGNRGALDLAFDGLIDEVRYSNAVRSPDWIQTSFNNQSSPAAFYNLGGEETAP